MLAEPKDANACPSDDQGLAGSRLRFSRSRRLLAAADFRRVFDRALKSSDRYLTLLAQTNGETFARLGLAISKRNVRKAVDRNRIKRLIRESFRLRQSELGSLDYVVLAKPGAGQVDVKILSRSLERHWNELVRQCSAFSSPSSNSTDT